MPLFSYVDGQEVKERALPDPDTEVVGGVPWGSPDAIFTPAYWMTQCWMHEGDFSPRCHRLGVSLEEEIVACLLGGHGIPAETGLAAFERLRNRGLIAARCLDSDVIARHLREPLSISGRQVTYRFWSQRAEYVATALRLVDEIPPTSCSTHDLRNHLLQMPGIGPKTASWIVRNWLDSDDVAILDIHIVRAGILMSLYSATDRVDQHYFRMERRFLELSNALNVRASNLDALIWHQMRSSPRLVARLLAS